MLVFPTSSNTLCAEVSVADLKARSVNAGRQTRLIGHDARATNRLLRQRNATLIRHAAELAKSNRRLAREVDRRKAAEAVTVHDRERYQALWVESQLMQRQLRLLTRQIISAQEEERKQISRELHDSVVQTLVGISVHLAALGRGASTDLAELKTRIARTQRVVEKSVKTVHRFARELRPAVLDDLGLVPALLVYCKALAARKNLKIRLIASATVERLESEQRTVLFRVAQEALTNVVRHAKATRVNIVITCVSGVTRMEIRDDGTSFEVDKILNASTKRLGLIGMRERVEMIGGTLGFESSPRVGTKVIVELREPMENVVRPRTKRLTK